jgi:hypothetical protein
MGNSRYSSIIIDLGTTWGKCQLHATSALISGKEPPLPNMYEAEWAPEPVWMLWLREKYLSLPEFEPRPSSPYSVAALTELSRLHNNSVYPGSEALKPVVILFYFFFNLHSGGWNQGPLDTAAT